MCTKSPGPKQKRTWHCKLHVAMVYFQQHKFSWIEERVFLSKKLFFMPQIKLEQSLLVWKIPWIIMKHQDSKLKILLHPSIAVDSHVIVNHYWFINECSNRTICGKITTIISINLGDNGALSELSTRKLSKAWPLRKLLEVS